MRSILVEYFRFDNLDTGILMDGRRYILACEGNPVKEVHTRVSHLDLLRKLNEYLRYDEVIAADDKKRAIQAFSDAIRPMFTQISSNSEQCTQIDLVLNASELGLLPFELLLDDDGKPLFASQEKNVVLTRRIRREFIKTKEIWPEQPRVLYVAVDPNYGTFQEVPYQAHWDALNWALKPWGGAQNKKVLTKLRDCSFERFEKELVTASNVDNKPYTHVHMLGHGYLMLDRRNPFETEFGIAFQSDQGEATRVDKLRTLFESLSHQPYFVNYMVCDGANFSNPLKPDKNPVQVTHRAGVPVVIGSQFPLSIDGSTLITEKLYQPLFEGKDVRELLMQIRTGLHDTSQDNHDWVSLVSYVRLPEGYEDYLSDLALKMCLTQLKNTRKKTDEVIEKDAPTLDDFAELTFELNSNLKSLTDKLKVVSDQAKQERVYLENAGLLGSVYKRLAELAFYKSKIIDLDPMTSLGGQKDQLQEGLTWYKKASDQNLSHHWSITQYLSLEVVLNGSISNMDYWYAARQAACLDAQREEEIWAFGSLIELYLLASKNEQPEAKVKIDQALDQLIARAKKKEDIFPLESTSLQLNRYRYWWSKENSYKISDELIVSDESLLNKIAGKLEGAIRSFYA